MKGILILGHAKITSSVDFSLEIEQLSIKELESASLFHLHFLPRSRMRVQDGLALAWFVAPGSTLAPLPNFTQASYDQVNELIHAKYVDFIYPLHGCDEFDNSLNASAEAKICIIVDEEGVLARKAHNKVASEIAGENILGEAIFVCIDPDERYYAFGPRKM